MFLENILQDNDYLHSGTKIVYGEDIFQECQ